MGKIKLKKKIFVQKFWKYFSFCVFEKKIEIKEKDHLSGAFVFVQIDKEHFEEKFNK